ncbi:glycosyl hydrolase 108 family protein [Nitratidesulfovibrio termitidis]|uniref:glycosyl hydrolase 108 family protein n=1 Tax=Nitratidesulfovibrio termitidis TaxID=42252 RepID=UPI0003FE9082|nr:glycosyl hydrolase 108 family protein [Nitratidesulfovibrio termitidis]
MRDIFEKAQAFVARWEGGLVDHANDPGGITNRGVSLRWLRAIGCDIDGDGDIDQDDIRAVTPEVAAGLFLKHFWAASGVCMLPPLVAVAVYDAAVNQGAERAVRQLQAACNTVSRDQLEVDGRIGNQTLRRVRALCTAMCGGQLAVCDIVITAREQYYRELANRQPKAAGGAYVDYRPFLRGWLNRTASLRGWCHVLASEGWA